MRYQEQLRPEQLTAYLARLGMEQPGGCSLEALNRLILAQLTHIPFESLDVWGAGLCPGLHLDEIYKKIVETGRGGYCFELNTLFRALLNGLGYNAWQALGSVQHGDAPVWEPNHNVILCDLSGTRYFLDVGFGGPVPFNALELREGQQGRFLLERRGDLWSLSRTSEAGYRLLLCFRETPVAVSALEPLNVQVSQNPDSHFRHLLHVSLRGADGSVWSIDGDQYKYHSGKDTVCRHLQTVDELKVLLRDVFHLEPGCLPLRDSL